MYQAVELDSDNISDTDDEDDEEDVYDDDDDDEIGDEKRKSYSENVKVLIYLF